MRKPKRKFKIIKSERGKAAWLSRNAFKEGRRLFGEENDLLNFYFEDNLVEERDFLKEYVLLTSRGFYIFKEVPKDLKDRYKECTTKVASYLQELAAKGPNPEMQKAYVRKKLLDGGVLPSEIEKQFERIEEENNISLGINPDSDRLKGCEEQ